MSIRDKNELLLKYDVLCLGKVIFNLGKNKKKRKKYLFLNHGKIIASSMYTRNKETSETIYLQTKDRFKSFIIYLSPNTILNRIQNKITLFNNYDRLFELIFSLHRLLNSGI